MKNYYKLKCLVTESFYENLLDKELNYTIGQTASKCFVDFSRRLSKKNIESVIVISTILTRLVIHEPKELKNFLEDYNKMLEILKKFNLDDYLEEEEKEDILYDIDCIEACIEKHVKKD